MVTEILQNVCSKSSCHVTPPCKDAITYRTISSYSLSLPFESRHFRKEMEASTFAGENVFGSFKSEIILSRIVLQ